MLEILGARPVDAQFGFFYGAPYQPRRARTYRPRQRLPPPQPKAVEIPLPPPRPRFPGDPPDAAETVTKPPAREAPAKPAVPSSPPKPETSAPTTTPQLPNPAPPTPAAPAKPETPAPNAAPAPAKPPLGPDLPPLPPQKPAELAKPAAPGVAPSGARLGETPGQPVDDATCPGRLKTRNVSVAPATIGPQPDSRCTVVQAVRLEGLTLPDGAKVDFPEHPTIACTTAETFSSFVRDLLSPLAKGTFGAPVSAVWTGPGLECRSMDHIVGAKLSAHGQGLAIDIAQLKLADGRLIEVGQAKNETGQTFETAARNAACGYFHTVLGPGTDSYHRTHWHFDLLVRGAQGDSKYCK